MHFEILIEDVSGKQLLDILVPKIIDTEKNTFRIINYKGMGRLPNDLRTTQDPAKRILLEQLPRLLRGYGRSFVSINHVIIIIVDCDARNCKLFKHELNDVLKQCNPKPNTFFRIAIEEIEAWLLGDSTAIQNAYPNMDNREYGTYRQDSIIGTWEKLADITLPSKTAKMLKKAAFHEVGRQKTKWAQNIGIFMNINNNVSPSFNCFKQKLEELAKKGSFDA
ncbi:MAG: DUF4276 family protein [Termitinemataceae bacterium]|nr:MAG: DUF4276 family protein [Termitinemataceae bacterium]